MADRINSMPKYVVSSSLREASWNNTRLIRGSVAEEVHKMKQEPGQDILLVGSAELVRALMPHDLIDEYRFMICPIVLGIGKRLFADGQQATLRLVDTKTFPSGVVLLTYQPAKNA
jgi:dihydrofolate reductase